MPLILKMSQHPVSVPDASALDMASPSPSSAIFRACSILDHPWVRPRQVNHSFYSRPQLEWVPLLCKGREMF
jgi:hypothetical protein